MPNIRVSKETLIMLRKVQGIFKAVSEDGRAPKYDEIIRTLLQPIIDLLEGRMELIEIPVLSWDEFVNMYREMLNQREKHRMENKQ